MNEPATKTESAPPRRNMLLYVAVAAVLIVGAGLIYFWRASATPEVASDCNDQTDSTEVTITYTSERKFSPSCVKVKSGTKVTYKNESSKELQVGANPHPVHTGNKGVSGGEFVLKVPANGTASVTLEKTGTFGFHDHLNASATATVEVQ